MHEDKRRTEKMGKQKRRAEKRREQRRGGKGTQERLGTRGGKMEEKQRVERSHHTMNERNDQREREIA